MTEPELRQAIQDQAVQGKVSCKAMLGLATRTGTPPGRIGKLCDEMEIRIVGCQLGCFK